MSQHTPGPWEAELHAERPSLHEKRHWTIEAKILDRYGAVADTLNMDYCIDLEEEEANARLIAAAPDLWQSAVAAASIIDAIQATWNEHSPEHIRSQLRDLVSEVLAPAIAKAQGGA
jgi:hypothetical protein